MSRPCPFSAVFQAAAVLFDGGVLCFITRGPALTQRMGTKSVAGKGSVTRSPATVLATSPLNTKEERIYRAWNSVRDLTVS